MFTAPFWRAAGERAVRTVAQTLLALWLVGDLAFNALTVDWGEALGVGLGAGILSLLTSLAAEKANPDTGPSLGTEKPLPAGGRRKLGDVGPEAGASELAIVLIVLGVGLVILDALVVTSVGLTVLGVCLVVGGVVMALLRR